MSILTSIKNTYRDEARIWTEAYRPDRESMALDDLGLELLHIPFSSTIHEAMPRETEVITDNPAFLALMNYYLGQAEASNEHIFKKLTVADRDICENNRFLYPFLKPRGKNVTGVIILFHGLNEKSYLKYLPWASRLVRETGKGVILFPIAFHMNRAPSSWSAPRPMMQVSKERKQLFPDLQGASFANTAISHRLQFAPQRFLLSGIQTFQDVNILASTIVRGDHPGIEEGAGIDLFGYSIGATLTEVLLMANSGGYFSDSRGFLFCGGAVLDQLTPVNKAILDNHSFDSIIRYFNKLLKEQGGREKMVSHLTREGSNGFEYFKSVLLRDQLRDRRENRIREIHRRLMAVALADDKVIPRDAIVTALQGEDGRIPTPVEVVEFSYPHSHENPFPASGGEDVEEGFNAVFSRAAAFLGNG